MGFTSVSDDDMEKPRCVLCYAVLSNEAMKPSKLKRHLLQKHPEHMEKDLSFFQRQKLSLKREKLDAIVYIFASKALQACNLFLMWPCKLPSIKSPIQ